MDKLDQPAKKRTKYEPTPSSRVVDEVDSDDLEEIDYGDDDDDDFNLDSDNQDTTTTTMTATTTKTKTTDKKQTEDLRTKINNQRGQRDGRMDEHENREGDEASNDHNLSADLETEPDSESEADGGQSKEENSEKASEGRCKYWPSCNMGDKCAYYHPSKPCKAFPNCMFGNKCLYIHPTCKFNPNCARPNCPFAHPVGQAPTTGVKRKAPGFFRTLQQPQAPKCKYGFKCTNLMCKFSHQPSEPCRFGVNCLLDTCPYAHPSDMARKKPASVFKWSAQSE